MSVHWADVDGDGIVIQTGVAPAGGDVPVGATILADPVTAYNAHSMYLDGGVWVSRPAAPTPAITEPGGVTTLTWGALPTGSIVSVQDSEIGIALADLPEVAGALEITLPDAGTYSVSIVALGTLT